MRDSLRRIYAIAYNTLIEALRNRVFITLLILAVLFVVFSIVLSGLAIADQQIRVLKDFGHFSVSTLSTIIAIVMGSILIYKEIEKKTFYVILTKPIRRLEVIIGKYLGLLAILAILNAILTSAWISSLASKGGGFSFEYLKSAVLIFFETATITSVVIFFSSFSTPITSGVLAGGVFIVGRVVFLIDELVSAGRGAFAPGTFLRGFGEVIVRIFPDLQVFNSTREILLDIRITPEYILHSGCYALSFIVIFLVLAIVIFERRDFI